MSRDFAQAVPPSDDDAGGGVTRLILRCGRGDEAALGQLFDLFYGPVAAALSRGPGDRSAEDLVIRAFVRLWSCAPTYRPQDQAPVEWVMCQTGASPPPTDPGPTSTRATSTRATTTSSASPSPRSPVGVLAHWRSAGASPAAMLRRRRPRAR